MTLSNQARGERYRQHTLELLGRLGYGSARQIAKGVWGQLTPSTRKMASRLLGRLGKERLVVSKRDGNSVNGEQLYALTKAGVARLTGPAIRVTWAPARWAAAARAKPILPEL